MTGFKSKKAISDSRFAVVYEDPEYDPYYDEEAAWAEYEAEVKALQEVEYMSPYSTINS